MCYLASCSNFCSLRQQIPIIVIDQPAAISGKNIEPIQINLFHKTLFLDHRPLSTFPTYFRGVKRLLSIVLQRSSKCSAFELFLDPGFSGHCFLARAVNVFDLLHSKARCQFWEGCKLALATSQNFRQAAGNMFDLNLWVTISLELNCQPFSFFRCSN